jgi:carboxyl-terminal processing protease
VDQNLEKYKKWQPFLLALCATLGLWAGLNMRQIEHPNPIKQGEAIFSADHSQKIKDVLSFIQSKYLDSIDAEMATNYALEGLLSNLDPFSEYIPAEYMHRYVDQIHGKLRGIGLGMIDVDSQYVVNQLKHGSPAEIKGISRGDVIIELDHHTLTKGNMNLDSIHDFIEDHTSDSIQIKWLSRLENVNHEAVLPLEELENPPVTNVHKASKQTLYVKINQLSKETYREFMQYLEKEFESGKSKDLIIDLRDNSGGLVHEAAYILNQLISDKDVLMFRTSGSKVKEREFRSTGKPFFKVENIAVLVNAETASAAELMAAVLQDLDRAIIIGTPTFGKAIVLEQFSLGDGSALRLAVSRYYTTSGRNIQKTYDQSVTSYLGNAGHEPDTVYYSKNNHRLVAHQGVIPDILVQDSSAVYSPEWFYTERLVAREYQKFHELVAGNPDNIHQSAGLNKFMNEKLVTVPGNLKPALLQKEGHYALARWFFGEDFEYQMRLMDDPVLSRALNELKNKETRK